MADDLQVKFGGDASGIRAAAQQAASSTQSFAATARAANAGLAAAFRDLTAELRANREAMVAQGAAAEATATATARFAAASRQAGDVLTDLKARLEQTRIGYVAVQAAALASAAATAANSGASAGNAAIAQSARDAASAVREYFTSAAYAERDLRLFAQANDGIRASIGQAILGVEAFVERLRLASTETARNQVLAIAAAGGLEQFRRALSVVDAGAKDTLVGFTAELEKIPGTSREAAAGIQAMLATVPNYSVDTNTILVNLLQTISKTGDEAVANAQKITAAFRDQQNGGRILGDLTADLKNLDDIQILATRIAAVLTPQQASTYFDTIIAKLRQQASTQEFLTSQNDAALRRYPLIGNAIANIQERLTGAGAAQREFGTAVTVATANLETMRRTIDGITAAQQREIEFQRTLNAETSQGARQQQIDAATAALRGRVNNTGAAGSMSGSERDLMIRTLYGEAGGESATGQEAVANVIRNRVLAGYGGAQSYQDVITAPRQFSVWNPGDPAGNTARNLSADSEAYRRLGEIVDRVMAGQSADPTKGATSYYNPNAASPSWGPTMTNQTTIGNHLFGNTPASPPVGDAAQQATIAQRLQEQADAQRRLNDEKRGGTETDLVSLDNAQKALTAARDEVAEAQRLVAARRSEVAAAQSGTPGARIAAARALAEAEQSLRDRETARDRSAAQLKVAEMESGSAERLRILTEAYTREQALYAQGSAEWNRLEQQKVAAKQAYETAQSQEQASAEEASYNNSKRRLEDRLRDIRAEASEQQISFGERRSQTMAVLAEIEALERTHQAKLAEIWGEGTSQYRQAQAQIAQIAGEAASRRRAADAEVNKAIYQDTKRSYEQIGSTLTSNVFQVIQGQQTIGAALRNTAMSIIQSYAQAKIRMLADYLAGVTTHTTGEATKTAATVAGVEARTSAEAAGAATSIATQGATMIKSIMGSAAETFAGIFGFLSPLMGPAAAGPAAAGEATVAAVASAVPASFAIGSWSLPGDMLANVHRGEMIVPAAATPWAQSLMAAAAGGGTGGGGGDTHLHVHAMDAAGVASFLRQHGGTIAKTVFGQGAANPSLRPGW